MYVCFLRICRAPHMALGPLGPGEGAPPEPWGLPGPAETVLFWGAMEQLGGNLEATGGQLGGNCQTMATARHGRLHAISTPHGVVSCRTILYVYIYIYIYIYVYYMHMYTCIYIYMYICLYVYKQKMRLMRVQSIF